MAVGLAVAWTAFVGEGSGLARAVDARVLGVVVELQESLSVCVEVSYGGSSHCVPSFAVAMPDVLGAPT